MNRQLSQNKKKHQSTFTPSFNIFCCVCARSKFIPPSPRPVAFANTLLPISLFQWFTILQREWWSLWISFNKLSLSIQAGKVWSHAPFTHTNQKEVIKTILQKMRSKSLFHIFMFNCRVRSFLLFNKFSYLLFIATCLIWDFYNQPLGIKCPSVLLEALERVPTCCTLYMNITYERIYAYSTYTRALERPQTPLTMRTAVQKQQYRRALERQEAPYESY